MGESATTSPGMEVATGPWSSSLPPVWWTKAAIYPHRSGLYHASTCWMSNQRLDVVILQTHPVDGTGVYADSSHVGG